MGEYDFEVSRDMTRGPIKILCHGKEKIGKTTWALGAPKPAIISAERGTEEFRGIYRVKRPSWETHDCPSWDDLGWAIKSLLFGQKHDRETVIVDTATAAEEMAQAAIIKQWNEEHDKKISNMEGVGYGKLYKAELARFRNLRLLLDMVIKENMNVIVVCHTSIETFANPEGADYNRYTLCIHKSVGEMLRKWADVIVLLKMRETVELDDASSEMGKKKGKQKMGKRERVLVTSPGDGREAGNRFNLPDELDDNPATFWKAIDSFWKNGGSLPTYGSAALDP